MRQISSDPVTVVSDTNKYLTQKDLNDQEARAFSQIIYLGKSDSLDRWMEVSKEEKETIEIEEGKNIII